MAFKQRYDKAFYVIVSIQAPHRDWRPDSMYHDLFSDFDFPLPENFNDDYEDDSLESKHDGNWDTS